MLPHLTARIAPNLKVGSEVEFLACRGLKTIKLDSFNTNYLHLLPPCLTDLVSDITEKKRAEVISLLLKAELPLRSFVEFEMETETDQFK
jgi:hypothetical protein